MSKHKLLAGLVFVSVFLFAASSTFAQQTDSAIIVGSVLDPTHAAVQGAKVRLTHLATNAVTEVQTNELGQYRTSPLRLGKYAISVEAAGFKRFTQTGIVLNISDVRQVDSILEVGAVSETVTVEAEAPLLETESSTVGTVITNKQIVELPLNGRDYLQLAALSSGTAPTSGRVGISVGGQPGVQIAFLLDGQDNNNQQFNTDHSGQKEIVKPSVDAIQEFKVVTNVYAAEYGRSSSGVISVALKSGTNQIHGAAYEFFRNKALDAENLFPDPTNPKPPFGRNQFGADIGAPIIRDKTFFFGDFEFNRLRQSQNVASLVPTATTKNGYFANPIVDPATQQNFPTQINPADGKTYYYIDPTRWDPIAAKILNLNLYPAPQTTDPNANFVYASPLNENNRRWDFRVDQIVSKNDNLYFRFSSQTRDAAVISTLPPLNGNYYGGGQDAPGEVGAEKTDSQSFVLVDSHVWSPSLVSSIRVGWNKMLWNNTFPNQQLKGLGIPGVNENYPGFSDIQVGSYVELGVNNVPNLDGSQDRQLAGDLTWSKQAHSVKFGVQQNWLQTSFHSSQSASGVFNFDGSVTGDPFADFLLGNAAAAQVTNFVNVEQRTPLTHFFAQDDWRVNRRLTLNLGLRYELSPPAVDPYNGSANVNVIPDPSNPKQLHLVAASKTGDRASRSLLGVDNHQVAPRFGFAYALPDNKTVVRGGYGIFYSYLVPLRPENNPPNHLIINTTGVVLSQGFPANALSVQNATNVNLTSLDNSAQVPITQQWNINIQRQLPGGVLLEVGYYGNKLDHMWRSFDANTAPPGITNFSNSRRPYQTATVPGSSSTITLGPVTRQQLDGYSRYNALQVKAEKRYSKGFTFIAAYAYSNTIALGDASGAQDITNVAAERAVALQDLTHHFVASAVYELPFGAGKAFGAHWSRAVDAILGGWSLSPIVTVNTGFPINLKVNGNPSHTSKASTDRPDIVGDPWFAGPVLANSDPACHTTIANGGKAADQVYTTQTWFNPCAFQKNAPGTYGNAGRDILRGPGSVNLDLAVLKSFRLTESVSAQLRLESFNATNTPALGTPATTVGRGNLGAISSAGTPRDNQIGLKVNF